MAQPDARISPGYTISFRIPQDTPPAVMEFLNTEKARLPERKFSSLCAAPTFIRGVLSSIEARQKISIQLPGKLTPEQHEWVNTKLVQQVLGQMIYRYVTENDLGEPHFNPTYMPLAPESTIKEEISPLDVAKDGTNSTPEFNVHSYHRKIAVSNFGDDA